MKDPTGSRAVPFLRIESERKRLFVSFLSVFLIGILAHGYAFANLTLSHDSLYELYLRGDMHYYAGSVTEWKISLGRFLCPVHRGCPGCSRSSGSRLRYILWRGCSPSITS